MTEDRDIKIIEAVLFASGEPVLEEDLTQKKGHRPVGAGRCPRVHQDFSVTTGLGMS